MHEIIQVNHENLDKMEAQYSPTLTFLHVLMQAKP